MSESASAASAPGPGLGSTVAAHYNQLEERGKEWRKESRIYHMRNLNNWIKSQLINEYVDKIRSKCESEDRRSKIQVLDIGCGKGGDLIKWSKAHVNHVTCADIAATSVEQAKDRYHKMSRRGGHGFSAEFIAADCTKQRLKDLYKDPNIKFDIVSCQFAFHYCFESIAQAEMMLQNISECLKPGGFFLGTTPDAYDIIHRIRKNGPESKAHANQVSVDCPSLLKAIHYVPEAASSAAEPTEFERIPLFGAKYNFHLEGVVDCPEFLVHFPTLQKLAEKHGLMLIAKRRFENYFTQQVSRPEAKELLIRMSGLECYPPKHGRSTAGPAENYEHARDFARGSEIVGTISKDEWEAATLYVIFAFKKLSS